MDYNTFESTQESTYIPTQESTYIPTQESTYIPTQESTYIPTLYSTETPGSSGSSKNTEMRSTLPQSEYMNALSNGPTMTVSRNITAGPNPM